MEYIIVALFVAVIGYVVINDNKKKPVAATKAKKPVSKKKALSVAELKKLTKVQLLEHADKNKIKVKRSGSKAEVVKAISQHK
tara:strand:+ start:686 stop:934 length:249 start_codon:yes stop_codon:yes gene_type:complete